MSLLGLGFVSSRWLLGFRILSCSHNILELKVGYNTMPAATQTFSGNMKVYYSKLHKKLFTSFITPQPKNLELTRERGHEVSYFGGGGQTDTGDFWRVEIEGSGKTWKQDQRIRLKHVDTSGYLHSHDKKYTRIAEGSERCAAYEIRNPTTSGWRRSASTFRFREFVTAGDRPEHLRRVVIIS